MWRWWPCKLDAEAYHVEEGRMKLTRLTPLLHVSDVERSLAFYRDGLGFTLVSPEAAVTTSRSTG
jgi:hypothetical protein